MKIQKFEKMCDVFYWTWMWKIADLKPDFGGQRWWRLSTYIAPKCQIFEFPTKIRVQFGRIGYMIAGIEVPIVDSIAKLNGGDQVQQFNDHFSNFL
jgi:hypothetical protein